MQTPRRTPRLIAVPLVLLAVGLWLTMTYGERWYHLPKYSEQDVSASVELNLALDLQQRGPEAQPDAAGIEQLRQRIRQEVTADIQRERSEIEQYLGMGLIALILAGGAFLADRLLQRR
jgi:hypothetical protein